MKLWSIMILPLTACSEGKQEQQSATSPPTAIEIPVAATATSAQSSSLMAMPEGPEALKRLEAMGYTIHQDHLHAPGVTSCPKMGDGPVM